MGGPLKHFRAPGGAASCLFVCLRKILGPMEDTFFRLLQFCTVQFETLPDDQVWDQDSKCYFPTRYELEGLAQFMFFGDLSEIRGSRLIQDVRPRNLQDNPIMGRRTHFRAPGGPASCWNS